MLFQSVGCGLDPDSNDPTNQRPVLFYRSHTSDRNRAFLRTGFPPISPPITAQLPAPVLRWKLDEGAGTNTADSSGNGYNGIINVDLPNANPIWITGPNGNPAISCNGNYFVHSGCTCDGFGSVYCQSNISQLSGIQHASISVWVWNTNYTFGCAGMASSDIYNFAIQAQGDEQNIYITLSNGTGTNFQYPWNGAIYGWHHYCATFDGTQPATSRLCLYVDGVLFSPGAPTSACPTTLPLAAELGGPVLGYDFDGDNLCEYDDFQLFTVTLTAAQVQANYLAGAQ